MQPVARGSQDESVLGDRERHRFSDQRDVRRGAGQELMASEDHVTFDEARPL